MTTHSHDDDALLTCEVCMKEIPKSVAQSLEGPDYVQYFCGNDCFSKWQEQKSASQENTEKADK